MKRRVRKKAAPPGRDRLSRERAGGVVLPRPINGAFRRLVPKFVTEESGSRLKRFPQTLMFSRAESDTRLNATRIILCRGTDFDGRGFDTRAGVFRLPRASALLAPGPAAVAGPFLLRRRVSATTCTFDNALIVDRCRSGRRSR